MICVCMYILSPLYLTLKDADYRLQYNNDDDDEIDEDNDEVVAPNDILS